MATSIKVGDWVRSIKKSRYELNERQCPIGEIRQVYGLGPSSITFKGYENNSCLVDRFEKVDPKTINFRSLYEKLEA